MKADDYKLEQLLEGSQQYVVPLFQRPYSWEKKHWDELWRDLLDVYTDKGDREHFMGAIVTLPIEMQPHGVRKYLLIDGQQRLTTISIILACIRDLVDKDNELSRKIEELYLINKWDKGNNRYKLLPTQDDRQAFLKVIGQETRFDSTICEAYNHFSKALKNEDNDGNSIDLENFLNGMIKQLVFVSIVLNVNEDPYRIFHSLNAAGEPLTQADLVRNHFFMHIPDERDQKAAHENLWLPMQKSLPGRELGDFIWRFITKDGVPLRQNAIYSEIRRRTLKKSSEEVVGIMKNMSVYSKYYEKIIDPSKEFDHIKIRARLKRLNRWGLTTSYPLLLNLYDDLSHNEITVEQFCGIMDVIESFAVRRFFCSIPIRALTNYFIRIYKRIANETDIVGAAYEFLLERDFPTDKTFMEAWIRFPLYSTSASGTERSRHILESLETVLNKNNEPVDMSHSRITREHIMPQNLSVEWHRELGDNADSFHSQYLHTVGNLTLTGQNESMGNKSFSEKKKVFANSSFALNSYFQDCDVWNEEEIIKRAHYLGEIATKIWKRPTS